MLNAFRVATDKEYEEQNKEIERALKELERKKYLEQYVPPQQK